MFYFGKHKLLKKKTVLCYKITTFLSVGLVSTTIQEAFKRTQMKWTTQTVGKQPECECTESSLVFKSQFVFHHILLKFDSV